jgi:2'-deoxynucleoside 5'-phosphate N-hydrolase
MIVYFCGSIAGGRNYLETYTKMVRYLQSCRHVVPTEHIIEPNVLAMESELTASQIYERDVEWLRGADAVIAEISNPSLGVGYEIAYALQHKKPVLALYAESLFISRMITGNSDPLLQVREYASDAEWRREMDSFLKRISR